MAVPNPDGPGGVGLRASSGGGHKAAAARSRVGVPAPFTRDSRTVRHANGSYTTTIYPHPAFYRTGGQWQPIDSTLVAAGEPGFAWRNKANQYGVSFARHVGSHYLRVRVAGETYDFDAAGAAGSAGRVTGSYLSYGGAYPGADLTYDVGSDAVNETIVLHDAAAPASYDFVIHPQGPAGRVSARRLPDGSWGVYRAPAVGPVFVLQAPRAVDARAGRAMTPGGAPHASMTVRVRGSELDVRMGIDRAWLSSPKRVFPVRLDPTITIQPDTQDASYSATCGNCVPYVGDRLYIGTDSSGAWRAALQFDLSAVPPGAAVTSAQLGLYDDGWCIAVTGVTGCTGNSHVIEAHRMTGAWSASTTSSQLSFDSTALSTVTVTDGKVVGWLSWPVTTTVQNWLSGAQPNDGLLLKQSTEPLGNSGIAVPSRTYAGSVSVQPELQVTYTSDAVTLLPPATLHSNGAELNWTQYTGPSGAPFQHYAIYRSKTAHFTPSPSTLLTTISDPAVTSYRDTTAAPGATFTYAVVANSDKSNEVTVTLPADGQATKTLQPDPSAAQDAFIYYTSGSTNCATYGADPAIYVGSDTSAIYRGLLRFSLNDIPASATVSSATLSVWQEYGTSRAVTLEAHRVTRAWTEGTGTTSNVKCTGDGATWYAATTGVRWASNGGDYDSFVAGSLAKSGGQQPSWDNLTITGMAQHWVDGTHPNHGVLLKLSSEPLTSGNYLVYNSGEFTLNPGLRPQLALTYSDGSHALPPAVSVSSPAPGATVSGSVVAFNAAASDDGAVDHVDFLVDGAVVATDTSAPYSFSWNSTAASNGAHTVSARAVDTAGNSATSAGVSVTVNNLPPPTVSVTRPNNNGTVSGTASVTASAAATSPNTVSKVDFYFDNQLIGTAASSPYTVSWNTLDPAVPAYDGSHVLTAKATDSSGKVTTSSAVNVNVANTAGTMYQAGIALGSGSTVPDTVTYDPSAGTQQRFGVKVTITNNSKTTFTAAGDTLAYRWYSPDSPSVVTTGPATSLGADLGPGKSVTLTVLVPPPALADGVDSAQYTLVFDLFDAASGSWFADRGNQPLTAQVQALRKSPVGLGLEKYYQYDTHPLGAGLASLVNVASGNLALNMMPWKFPGRGLSSVVELTYNGLENHSRSPVGNNWSLAVSSLSRFGTPLQIHPNNADSIAGVSDKLIGVTDGDGTLHVYTGTTNPDGTTTWTPPPGFDLYLRSVTTDTSSPSYWALSRPDHVTFYYNYAGWPTSVVDKNGNPITFTETPTPPGEDPGGPPFRITQVTDPGGRAITVTYYTKAQTDNAHQRGRISDITDPLGHDLHLDYYNDGNLLRITERGGTNADGSFLPDRSWVFTYMNSQGSGAAILNAADRVNPDPKTPNEDSQIYSVRDPRGHESLYTYYLNSDGPTLAGRVKSLTDRDAHTTTYSYDTTGAVTTVTDPLSHATTYAYDPVGRVTRVTNPLGQHTDEAWTADNEISKITENNGKYRLYNYNANGYLTDYTDQDLNHTVLTYENRHLDATDPGYHWSLLSTKTAPKGVAAGSGYQWAFSYDAAGNMLTAQDPLHNTTTYCYNLAVAPPCNTANEAGSPGTVHSVTDFNGNTTTYSSYAPSGQPQQVSDPLGRVTRFGFDADGNLLFTQDPVHAGDSGSDVRSYRMVYDYDSYGRLGRVSQPKSTSLDRGNLIWTDTSYDPNDNVTAVQDAHYGQQDAGNGPVTTSTYSAMDRLKVTTSPDTQADPAGQRTSRSYDAAGRLITLILPKGVQSGVTNDHTTKYSYDAASELTGKTEYALDSTGAVSIDTRRTYYCYDDVGNRVSVTAANAGLTSPPDCSAATIPNTTRYVYDAAHLLKSVTDPMGHQQKTDYDADGNVSQTTDANGNITVNSYDQKDQLVKVVAPFVPGGRTTTTEYVYDANGNKIKDISPRAYDASADKTTFTDYVTSYEFDADNEMVRETTPSDANTPPAYIHYYYDPGGRQIAVSLPVTVQSDESTQVPAAAKTISTYFDPGWVASSKDPAVPAEHFDYTAQGWQHTRIPDKPGGGLDTSLQETWEYYPNGLTKSYTDRGGQSSSYHYDADSNLTYASVLDGSQTPVQIYADYTDFEQVAATHYAATGGSTFTGTAYTYDHDGNVAERDDNSQESLASQTTNSDGVPISWSFTQTGPPDINKFTYDSADWLKVQDDLNTTPTSCNADRRITTSWFPTGQEDTQTLYVADSSCTYNRKQTSQWTYFDNGKTMTHTTKTVQNGTDTVVETHTLGYQTNGIYLNGNTASDAFALNGPSSTVCTGSSPSCTATYSYDARDRLKSTTDGHGGTTTYTFDGNNSAYSGIRAGNITTQATTSGGTTTTTSTYKGTQLTGTATGGTTNNYWYDGLGRLTCVTTSAGTAASCNTVNSNSVSAAVITASAYDFMDRFTATHTFSGGTQTSSAVYSYDALDRTAQETETHDAANLRRVTTFAYQGLTNLVSEEDRTNQNLAGTTTTGTDTKTYNYDAYGNRYRMHDVDTPTGGTANATSYEYGYNPHGDVSLVTNQPDGSARASYGYTPYGALDPTLSQGDTSLTTPFNPFRYSAKRFDSGAKNYDMGVRRYDPAAQRFLQMDQFQGALSDLSLASDPLTQNRYDLAASNPLSGIEWDGHMIVAPPSGCTGTQAHCAALANQISNAAASNPQPSCWEGSYCVRRPQLPQGWSFQRSGPRSGVVTHTWQQRECSPGGARTGAPFCWMQTEQQQYNVGTICSGGARTGAPHCYPASDFLTPSQGTALFWTIMAATGSTGLSTILAAEAASGSLDVIGSGFSASERGAAEALAAQGRNVVLRQATGVGRTSDLLVNGTPYDVYTPTTGNLGRIVGAIASKGSQVNGGGVVLDLSKSPLSAADVGNILPRVQGITSQISDIIILGG